MKSLQEQITELRSLGYATDTARAKVAHDIILVHGKFRCNLR